MSLRKIILLLITSSSRYTENIYIYRNRNNNLLICSLKKGRKNGIEFLWTNIPPVGYQLYGEEPRTRDYQATMFSLGRHLGIPGETRATKIVGVEFAKILIDSRRQHRR